MVGNIWQLGGEPAKDFAGGILLVVEPAAM
jgi:hypothetical protein